MGDSCPVCGGGYVYGPGGRSHADCQDVMQSRARVDEAVAWVMSDDPNKGPMPELVKRLRQEILDGHEDSDKRTTTRRARVLVHKDDPAQKMYVADARSDWSD